MRKAVVYIGMTYPHGIIRHFALLALEMEKLRRSTSADFDLYFASTDGETGQNAWPMIRDGFASDYILSGPDFAELSMRIADLTSTYDCVLVHTGGGWGQTKHLVRARSRLDKKHTRRLRFVATTHAFRIDSWHRIWMSAFQCVLYALFYDKVVFQCRYAASRFQGAWLLSLLGKKTVIPLGCETFDEVPPSPPQGLVTNGLANVLDGCSFVFVYLAQFRPGKMHMWLVQALAPVMKDHPAVHLLLCGMGDDVILKQVRTYAEQEGLAGRVLTPGQIPRCEVPWLLTHSNCAVVPSRGETFGHNFIEPMFAGLPVLGTRVGIGCEVIEDGVTGYGFSLTDVDGFRRCAKVLVEDVKAASRMGVAARERVESKYRHSDVARQLIGLYAEVMEHAC